ncbi:hypothetical protein [uncultured Draconibacterium sp.]|uniref:hypothetical protein n=1 Tax=uncultured Draconibacterium sp. TaxID=1573823 RepID=UPI0025EDF499|nr:hypothetical protein [uncultured Draconibacterium sp.]
MLANRWLVILLFLLVVLRANTHAQTNVSYSINILKKEIATPPGKVVNIPFFIVNNSSADSEILPNIILPEGWELVTSLGQVHVKAKEQNFQILSVKVPAASVVGDYNIEIVVGAASQGKAVVRVQEVEKISLQLIEAKEHVMAGEEYRAGFIVVNDGNTEKTVFIETQKCNVDGEVTIKLQPGEKKRFEVVELISKEITNTRRDYISVVLLEGGVVKDRIFKTIMIFPVKGAAEDLFFRFPVNASVSYMGVSQYGVYQSAYQYEISGSGSLDPAGKHQLEFVARGPDNIDLSYLGTYDQYYLNYSNQNIDVTVGEKTYQFTPLTESSRYGFGVENKINLKNGLLAGFTYVRPRFYEDINYELAISAGYAKPGISRVEGFFIQKKDNTLKDMVCLMSLNTMLKPFKKTTFEMELSRGFTGDIAGNAFRGNINSQFSVFSVRGEYYNVGKDYPGYFSNSKFYSGAVSVRLTKKLNAGVFARQDFTNAQLDTFFVTAPYTRSLQYSLNYNLAPNTSLRIYWNESERKDRLSQEKFHYNSRLINTQFQQKINRFNYSLTGAYGKTSNYLLSELSSKQNTYRFSTAFGFQFNTKFSVRAFGSYSNLNSIVSEDQQNLIAGIAMNGKFANKLNASLYLQNAYDIDDYYRNRNLLQFNLSYKVTRNHQLAFQTYYTLFRNETENPELYLSANYTYTFGVPLKQVTKAGDLTGHLVNLTGDPMPGIQLQLLNKTAITDKNGRFAFYAVAPGVHVLGIDRAKLELDEMPDMPDIIRVEILEDQETELDIVITRGVKIRGKIQLIDTQNNNLPSKQNPKLGNIIVELRNDFKYYRVLTDENGVFSFPLVVPHFCTLKVYENSLPENYVLLKNNLEINLSPGEQKEFLVELKKKERKIIFKSQGFSLSGSGATGFSTIKPKEKEVTAPKSNPTEEIYTVQVGAFSKQLSPDSPFFKGRGFDFEKQIDNFYKYFMGRFKNLDEAKRFKKELETEFRSAYVVVIKGGKVLQIDDH